MRSRVRLFVHLNQALRRSFHITAVMSSSAFVEDLIASKAVVVFSKSYCPFCVKAKKTLEKYKLGGDKYEVVELEDRDDCDDIQDYLKAKTGARSVPRVFIGGRCIGGGDETVKLESSGELAKLLKNVNAI